jgi:hypothetical protein
MLCRSGIFVQSQENTSGNQASGGPELIHDAVTSISQQIRGAGVVLNADFSDSGCGML